jgi:rubrerythrin
MDKFGKNCPRCGSYFLGGKPADQMCPWCTEIQAGIKQRGLYVSRDDIETLEL